MFVEGNQFTSQIVCYFYDFGSVLHIAQMFFQIYFHFVTLKGDTQHIFSGLWGCCMQAWEDSLSYNQVFSYYSKFSLCIFDINFCMVSCRMADKSEHQSGDFFVLCVVL